jgi:hypothetical protein
MTNICEAMPDRIFQSNPRHHDLDDLVAASREQWWGTPRFRDQMAVGDWVWLQVVGPKDPGIYYVATLAESAGSGGGRLGPRADKRDVEVALR